MVKKALFVGAGAVLLLGLLFGRDAASYISTTMGWVHQSVKDSVPVEFEIERAKKMIASLDGDIERNMTLIAREEVEVSKLVEQSAEQRDSLAKRRDDILRLTRDLESGSENFVYAGVSYSAKQVRDDLSNRFERFKVEEQTVDSLRKILDARKQGLSAAQEKLNSMLASKRQLEVDVENLEARLKMLEVAKTNSNFKFDDSRLSRTKQLIEDIEARLQVAETLVDSKGSRVGEIQLDGEEQETDIVDEVTDFFGEGRSRVEALVDTE